jgi:predicted anti-sigma-YlaC factor YlaD
MLKCREMSELASDFLEGQVPWTVRIAAQWHLVICPNCRRYFRQLRLTIETIRRVRPREAAVNTEKVLAEIDRAGS